jgi:PAS domain S-box-containing protein
MDNPENTRAEKELRATDILESIAEGFFALDREWRFTYINREGQRILDKTPDELIGKVIWDVYTGLVGSPFEPIYRRAMDDREAMSILHFYPDHQRYYDVHTYPAPHGISAYFRNVTDQKLADAETEALVSESERQRRIYEVALSNTPDLVYVFDLDRRFVYANEALLKMWGRRREDTIGKTNLEIGYDILQAESSDHEIDQVIATKQPIRGEAPFTSTAGTRTFDYILVPVIGPDGAVVAVAGTTRDITDRKRAEQEIRDQADQLRELDRAKDQFLATLAHELRNPLAPLLNAAEVLGALKIDDKRLEWTRQVIRRQVTHMSSLLDDLLNVARITQGKLTIRPERVDLATVIDAAIEAARPLIDTKHHQLTVELTPAHINVDADPIRLSQILSNLLLNAAKYTDSGGQIDLRASRDDEHLVLSVKDDGIGIPASALGGIFTMFAQVEGSARRSEGGLGIGLALVRGLVELHGGSIQARSDGPGQGSEFIVRLPLPVSDIVAPASGEVTDTPRESVARRILVADDNRDAADTLSTILRMSGHEVFVAHGGQEALDFVNRYRPDFAILDVGMPDLSGYDVARGILAGPHGKHMTLVALTGYGQQADKDRAFEAGFSWHLTKPITFGELEKILTLPTARDAPE